MAALRQVVSAISIHALLAESDLLYTLTRCASQRLNFYPRSPCGERQVGQNRLRQKLAISIHALLAESDNIRSIRQSTAGNFYPRSPCGERPTTTIIICTVSKFLSTLSLRRATSSVKVSLSGSTFLSTLSLRRATWLRCWQLAARDISIHALLAESDLTVMLYDTSSLLFLSTLSLRRATKITITVDEGTLISIHALLAESDVGQNRFRQKLAISIHALLAESDSTTTIIICTVSIFLSTLSLRRATHYDNYNLHCVDISIHALLAESDRLMLWPFRPC